MKGHFVVGNNILYHPNPNPIYYQIYSLQTSHLALLLKAKWLVMIDYTTKACFVRLVGIGD
jgi:hypothetical protein